MNSKTNKRIKMGSCISKCKPKKHYIQDLTHVQDKIVISSSIQQPPKTPIPKISPLPISPTASSSSSSISSFTRSTINTATTTTSSCYSVSSSASVLSSKLDRSFSNEYLWACVKENPHIVRINSIKEASRTLASFKSPSRISNSPARPVATPAREKGSTPQKRGRSSSPSTLTRQKSFRKDTDHRINSANYNYLPCRGLRSPSPSRRFNGDNNNYRGLLASTSKEIRSSKRIVGPKVNALNSVASSQRRENFRVLSPKLNGHDPSTTTTPLKSCLRNRETFIHRISSKIDETALKAALSTQQENEPISMEDIDNPLISLDCFIFL